MEVDENRRLVASQFQLFHFSRITDLAGGICMKAPGAGRAYGIAGQEPEIYVYEIP